MEPESAEPTVTVKSPNVSDVVSVGVTNENKEGEVTVIDVQLVEQVNAEIKSPEKEVIVPKESVNADQEKVKQEALPAVNTIIGEDEDGEAIDMADIRVLEDLENKSPEKEEVVANKSVKVEVKDEEDSKDPEAKKRKSYEFFYPDMVSTLELALRGLPSMANCQQAKAISPQKGPPPKGPLQKGAAQKRPTPIRDFAKEAKKALKKSGNIIEVRGTRKSTRTAVTLTKPVNSAGDITAPKTVSPKKPAQPVILLDRVQVTQSKDIKPDISPEPVAKKARNTPKAAGKKSKIMPQAVAKQPAKVISQVVAKPAPAKDTTPKVKIASAKTSQETIVVAPGGRQMTIAYPPPSSTVFRPFHRPSREWRKKGPGRTRTKGCGLIVDNQKEIPTVMMKMRVSDTSDIVTSLDLAPPTKKLMQLREAEGSKETINLFSVPGRNLTPRLAWRLFYPNLMTKPKGDDSDSDDDVLGDDMAVEEDNPGQQKKCFTIIRSEPLDLSDGEDIHYTNVLSDEDDDGGPVYAAQPTSVPIKVEQKEEETVPMDTSVATISVAVISQETDSTNQQDIAAVTENQSQGQIQETPSSISEDITPQTVPATAGEYTPSVVQGEVECVAAPQLVAIVSDSSGSNPTVVNTEMDTSVVDISLTSLEAGQAVSQAASIGSTATIAPEDEGCVIVSVVTEISEPYVEHGGEIMLQTDSSNNPGEKFILYMEK